MLLIPYYLQLPRRHIHISTSRWKKIIFLKMRIDTEPNKVRIAILFQFLFSTLLIGGMSILKEVPVSDVTGLISFPGLVLLSVY